MNTKQLSKYFIMEEIDKTEFFRLLSKYYKEDSLEKIKPKLKKDLKNQNKTKLLINYTKFGTKDFFFYLATLYDDLFTKSMIRKFKEYIKNNPT